MPRAARTVGTDGLLEAALDYARMGWPVLPLHSPRGPECSCGDPRCESPAKHPRTRTGLKEATTDEATVRRWWMRWPDANVGLRTGIEFDVLDADGDEGLHELEQSGSLPGCPTVITGHGGHFYFRPTGRGGRVAFAPGLDWRGRDSYVVAPPSRHLNGRVYRWANEFRVPPDTPEWLAALLAAQRGATAPRVEAAGEAIPKGRRDATLASIAGTMRRRGLTEEEILAALTEVNRGRCKPPLGDDQVAKVARSVARYPPEPHLARIGKSMPGQVGEGGLVEIRGSELVNARTPALETLPLLGARGYIGVQTSTLIAAYPKVGKTTLLREMLEEWAREGHEVLVLTEEPQMAWELRLFEADPELWDRVVFVPCLGVATEALLERAGAGAEDVVVHDTLRSVVRFTDETNNAEVATAVNPWIALAREGDKTFVALHHTTKSAAEHGKGIAGGHALFGVFDAALEVLRMAESPTRRRIRCYARLLNPPELAYELDGTRLRSLGDAGQVHRADVRNEVRGLVGTEKWATVNEVRAELDDPKPSARLLREVMGELVSAGALERDPRQDKRGATYKYRGTSEGA
jgi:hypothetical protein